MKTSHLQRWVWLVLTLSVLPPTIAGAQPPWTVTITPTMNPLPIGFCGAVHLNVTDRNGERPRNPAAQGVALADFDMSVTSPATRVRAVVGKQDGPSSWGVCGCQAGVVGEVATITASYPSARLRSEQRVPGVAFKTTTTFTLAQAKGSADATGCSEPVTIAAGVKTLPVGPAFPPGALEMEAGLLTQIGPPTRAWIKQEAARENASGTIPQATAARAAASNRSQGSLGSRDIDVLAFLVMMEAARSWREDPTKAMSTVSGIHQKFHDQLMALINLLR